MRQTLVSRPHASPSSILNLPRQCLHLFGMDNSLPQDPYHRGALSSPSRRERQAARGLEAGGGARGRGFGRARACVRRTIPNDLIANIESLFFKYGRLSAINFSTLYTHTYETYFDPMELGFDEGLEELFCHLPQLKYEIAPQCLFWRLTDERLARMKSAIWTDTDDVSMTDTSEGEAATSSTITSTTTSSAKATTTDEDAHMNGTSSQAIRKGAGPVRPPAKQRVWQDLLLNDAILWLNEFEPIRHRDLSELYIPLSPYEQAEQRSASRVQDTVERVRKLLARHPEGLKQSKLRDKVHISLGLFNSKSYDSLVSEFPELFYCVDFADEYEEPLIFDGNKVTHDFIGKPQAVDHVVNRLVVKTILSGVYQKTLMLLRKCGPAGLKLAVWRKSVEQNWPDKRANNRHYSDIMSVSPVRLFQALTAAGMVELRSDKACANDLKIYLPHKEVNFRHLFKMFKNFLRDRHQAAASAELDDNQTSTTSASTTSRGPLLQVRSAPRNQSTSTDADLETYLGVGVDIETLDDEAVE